MSTASTQSTASDPMDENGHGTHCAGIIGAEGENNLGIAGVNWKVQIMPLKFMNAGGFGTTKDAIEAINYVIDRKKAGVNVRIISASWGSTQKSRALGDVIRKAYENDILFVAAAGNSSVNNDRNPHFPSSYDVPNVVSVAAFDRHDAARYVFELRCEECRDCGAGRGYSEHVARECSMRRSQERRWRRRSFRAWPR